MRWVALLLAVLLTGCATIPSEGPVEEVSVPSDPQGIDIAPRPPAEDANPDQILEGFLLAMTEPEGDYQIARSYLSEEAAELWEPTSSTNVYVGGVEQADPEDPTSYRLEGTLTGHVDEEGRFTPDAGLLVHDFTLVDVDGQWRISTPPEGLLVSRYLFDRLYTPVTLYFMAYTGDHVMPELVTWPEQSVTPTRIVEALLQGPSDRLLGSATNAIPAGARLGEDEASVDAQGVVTVDFTGLHEEMTDADRRDMGVQLLFSLTAVPRVTGVRVTNDGSAFSLPGQSADGVLELATHQNFQVLARATSQDLFGVQDEVPGRFGAGDDFRPFPLDMPSSSELAISIDGSRYAVVSQNREVLYHGPMEASLTAADIPGTRIRDAQFVLGELYALADDEAGTTRLYHVPAEGPVGEIEVDLPAGATLSSVSLSQTGATAAVIIRQEGESILGEMSLFLGNELQRFRRIPIVAPSGTQVRAFTDVEWNSETTWVVTGLEGGESGIYIARIDGAEVEELGSFEREVAQVAALPRQGGGLISLLTTDGRVWRYESPARWISTTQVASSITYAG